MPIDTPTDVPLPAATEPANASTDASMLETLPASMSMSPSTSAVPAWRLLSTTNAYVVVRITFCAKAPPPLTPTLELLLLAAMESAAAFELTSMTDSDVALMSMLPSASTVVCAT